MRPLVQKDAAQHHLDGDGGSDRQQSLRVAFENAEREIADEQNQRDEDRRQKGIDAIRQRCPSVNGALGVVCGSGGFDCATGWLIMVPSQCKDGRA